MMQKVEGIIRPDKLEEVKDALDGIGVRGMSVSEIRGCGRSLGHTEHYRGNEYTTDFVTKAKIEILVAEEQVDEVVQTIEKSACTGRLGDGKILVVPIGQIV